MSTVSLFSKPLGVGEEGGGAAGVPVEDVVVGGVGALADEVDEASDGAAGVDGADEDAFSAGEEASGFDFGWAEDAVATAEVVGVEMEVLFGEVGGLGV